MKPTNTVNQPLSQAEIKEWLTPGRRKIIELLPGNEVRVRV
jgi:hypothetical protein